MDSFDIHAERCPICHRSSDCTIHAHYDRYVIDFIGGRPVCHMLKILRVICTCCGHTHAILPDPIIPYGSYSLFFILRVLAEYFLKTGSIAAICGIFSISPPQLYRWAKLYQQHRREWQGLLKSVAQDRLTSLKELVKLSPFMSFKTLEKWVSNYQRFGFDALMPNERSDKGSSIIFDGDKFPLRVTDKNENCHAKRNNGPSIDYSKLGASNV